jgi:hypothetical protein
MNTLSKYAEEEFAKFVQNKHLQEQLSDLIGYRRLYDIDEICKICLDMFLTQIEISKLDPYDMDLLKLEIRHIRSIPINDRKMTSEICDQIYGGIKMLDEWSNLDFYTRIREGRETKRLS